jgi:hypothetical protein
MTRRALFISIAAVALAAAIPADEPEVPPP